jgi:hypothetical protein
MLFALPLYVQAQAGFPMVDKVAQRARDDDRRLILETELAAERADLAKAQAQLATGATSERQASAHRHQENVNALLRELGERPPASKPQERAAQLLTPAAAQAPTRAPDHAPARPRAPHAASMWDAASAWDDCSQASDSPSSSRTKEAQ